MSSDNRPTCCHHSNSGSGRQSLSPISSPRPTLAARYGEALLAHGHTAIPNLVLEHYAALGLSDAEALLLIQIWSFWWEGHDPCPSVATLAARLGKTVRQVQHHLGTLRARGFLEAHERRDARGACLANGYDVRPFLRAIEALLARQAPAAAAVPDPTVSRTVGDPPPSSTESPLQPAAPLEDRTEDPEDLHDLDSIDPQPPCNAAALPVERTRCTEYAVAGAIERTLRAFGDQLGDRSPRSSLGRVLRLLDAAGIDEHAFLPYLEQAAAITRSRHAARGMPYFLAVLSSLIEGGDGAGALPVSSPVADRPSRTPLPGPRPRRASAEPSAAGAGAEHLEAAPQEQAAEHPRWDAVALALAATTAPGLAERYIRPLRGAEGPGGALVVIAPSRYAASWVERQLGRRIVALLREQGGEAPRVIFTSEEAGPAAMCVA